MRAKLSPYFALKAIILSLLGAILAFSSSARDVTVGVANGNALAFFPAVTNISTGDRVIWVWNNTSNLHSTTASGLWDSGLVAAPHSFTNTFNTPGNFPYFCSRHVSFGMTGAVVVATAILPPTLAITNPAPGTVFAAPASVTIQAAVTNGSGTVTNVEFLVGGSVLANKTVAPYSAVTGSLAAGNYTLSAIAMDTDGSSATNATTIGVVTPVAVAISAPTKTPPANFSFNYTANVGLSYLVQKTTNLLATQWQTLATNKAAASPVPFTDTNAGGGDTFYRVERMPNP